MSSLAIHHEFGRKDPGSRLKGLVVVVALHAIVFYLLVTGVGRRALEIVKKPMEAVVIQEVIIPPPPPPPKKERPPEAAKVEAPPPPFVPPTEVATPPTNAPTITSVAAPPPTPAAIAPPPPVAAPVAAKAAEPPAVDVEAEYSAKVRAMLNSTKRYPTGREASQTRPQGRVKLWFTLTRAGALVEVGLLESSNNNLLDSAALATVRRGTFPPFPEKGWVGHDQNKFSAEIEFLPPSQ